jgi:hypothetical protein
MNFPTEGLMSAYADVGVEIEKQFAVQSCPNIRCCIVCAAY